MEFPWRRRARARSRRSGRRGPDGTEGEIVAITRVGLSVASIRTLYRRTLVGERRAGGDAVASVRWRGPRDRRQFSAPSLKGLLYHSTKSTDSGSRAGTASRPERCPSETTKPDARRAPSRWTILDVSRRPSRSPDDTDLHRPIDYTLISVASHRVALELLLHHVVTTDPSRARWRRCSHGSGSPRGTGLALYARPRAGSEDCNEGSGLTDLAARRAPRSAWRDEPSRSSTRQGS